MIGCQLLVFILTAVLCLYFISWKAVLCCITGDLLLSLGTGKNGASVVRTEQSLRDDLSVIADQREYWRCLVNDDMLFHGAITSWIRSWRLLQSTFKRPHV
jgi:uncharacterized membrane protein